MCASTAWSHPGSSTCTTTSPTTPCRCGSARPEAYGTRYQWPRAATYGPDVSNPAQALGIAAPAAALRFAEVKAAVGGVTAIQGSPPLTRTFPGWMVRNVENEKHGTGQRIFQSVLPATDKQLDSTATASRRTGARSSTTSPKASTRRCAKSSRSSTSTTASATGSSASTRRRSPMPTSATGTRQGGGAVVWSPFSNLWLYGGTTDIVNARRRGLRVCLGSDWTPSGTRNVLGELKVATRWNRVALAGALDPEDLVELVTANPGDTLAGPWGVPVGRLVEGGLADLACFTNVRRRPVAQRARGDRASRATRHRRRTSGVRQPVVARTRRRARAPSRSPSPASGARS